MVTGKAASIDEKKDAAAKPRVPNGYKQTQVGVIPEDWAVESVQEFAAVMTGPFGTLLNASEYSKTDGVPLISVGEIREGFFRITDDTPRIPETVIRRLPQYVLRKGDIVFGRKGGVERSALIRQPQEGWFLGSDGISVRPSPDCHDEYLAHQFRSTRVQGWLIQHAIGTTMPSLNQDILRRVIIPLPPTKAEQEAIAEALADADALIESLGQLITKKRHIKQGAMQELLTGKKRLWGFEQILGYKRTEAGLIPKDWAVAKLSEVCAMKSGEGITSANIEQFSKYPCYGGNGLRGFTSCFTHDGRYALIGRQGALCGNVLGVDGKFYASEHAVVVTASARTDIRWLTFVLGEMRLNRYSESSAQPGLSVWKLLHLQLAAPSTKAEQVAIASILSDTDAEIAALEGKQAKARMIKQGMMQELLTGRIRLV